ncbi:sugar transporter [Ramaria rubella]|nr:sugar transporter [Ramaria rubella]
MLHCDYGYNRWGSWLPLMVPESSLLISVLLVLCSCITSTTFGYDGSMINGLNILPSYTNYFGLNPVTTGLNTASIWIGGCLAGMTFGKVTDVIGRRPALFFAALITVIAVVLQTAAQDVGMFVLARILVGFGTSASGLTGPTYLAETLPVRWRAWGLGVFNDFYYVGGLIAAGVTFGTSFMNSTWAWRIPSLIQGLFSILCIVILPFIPESPRWLAFHGRPEEALTVLAQTYANGDRENPTVKIQFKEILDTMEWERQAGQQMRLTEVFRTRNARKRVLLACSAALFSTIAGNVIASYYLGSMLGNAGITNTTTQLQINIILNAWCLICSLVGTYSADQWGRKPTTVLSTALLTVFIFMIGALTKVYGSSQNTSGIYATVAAIFLFQGSYSFGWTPVLYLYPPEVLHYPIRANGMGVFQFVLNAAALVCVFAMPIAIANIGWKTYMINGAWDVLMVAAIQYWWVETKGKTLEEIDEMIEGVRHSDVVEVGDGLKGEQDDSSVKEKGEKF